ncbi:MAG: hypothetical protein P1P63_04840 [Treponemataceae bacterium]
MKLIKLLPILTLFLTSLTATAQLQFSTTDVRQVRQLADSITAYAKRVYDFKSEGVSKRDRNYYTVNYTNAADPDEPFGVAFRIKMVGSNQALEIEGTPQYTFALVYGRFLDLFPFWKRFIDPNASAGPITQQREAKAAIQGLDYVFRESGGLDWEIRRVHK